MSFGSLKSIIFIFSFTFLLIESAFSYGEQSSNLQNTGLLENPSQEEYYALADEVLHRIKVPERQAMIIKRSNESNNEKIKKYRDSIVKENSGCFTEKEVIAAAEEYLKIWNKVYYEKIKYDNIKHKIINKFITNITYKDLNSLNEVLKYGGRNGYTKQDNVTFTVVLGAAKEATMEASVETMNETLSSGGEIIKRLHQCEA